MREGDDRQLVHIRKIYRLAIIQTALCALILTGCTGDTGIRGSSTEYAGGRDPMSLIGNCGDVVDSVRGALVRYSSCITVRFVSAEDIRPELLRLADELMDSAMEYTSSPVEGDYIKYQCGGYESSYTSELTDSGWENELRIVPKYYSYLEYEEAVTGKVQEIVADFGFDENTTDLEKIRVAYDYVCRNVTYDRIHARNENYCLRSTAYAALIWGNATCQGYCVTLYRLLREVGVNTRIITGSTEGESADVLHAWNIVELDNAYYNLDATWDAGKENYDYFLKGSDFSGHVPGADFVTEEFRNAYPVAGRSYTEQ